MTQNDLLSTEIHFGFSARLLKSRCASRGMDRLKEIHVPTLILHGKKDTSAPYHLAEAMHSGIRDSHLLTFPGGHLFSF